MKYLSVFLAVVVCVVIWVTPATASAQHECTPRNLKMEYKRGGARQVVKWKKPKNADVWYYIVDKMIPGGGGMIPAPTGKVVRKYPGDVLRARFRLTDKEKSTYPGVGYMLKARCGYEYVSVLFCAYGYCIVNDPPTYTAIGAGDIYIYQPGKIAR